MMKFRSLGPNQIMCVYNDVIEGSGPVLVDGCNYLISFFEFQTRVQSLS